MSARKRARTSEATIHIQHVQATTKPLPPAHGWHALLRELFQQAVVLLLQQSDPASILQLFLLSSVCAGWHRMVYHEGISGGWNVDFWSCCGTVSVFQEDEQDFSIAGKQCGALVVHGALVSLRHVHSLSVCFEQYTPLVVVVAVQEPLQRYIRLTSLNVDMRPLLRVTRIGAVEVQDALYATLAAIASRNQLISLALQCPAGISSAVDNLRRLCSSVLQLSLSQHELLMMAWGEVPASNAELDESWRANSVQSLEVPPGTPRDYFSTATIAAVDCALPSLTHLHLQCQQHGAKAACDYPVRGSVSVVGCEWCSSLRCHCRVCVISSRAAHGWCRSSYFTTSVSDYTFGS